MNSTSETSERHLVLVRGRKAFIAILVGNAAALVVAGGLSLTSYSAVGHHLLLWLAGIQLLLLFVWFLPVFLFQLTVRRRGLAESWARALWSFVEALSQASP